MLEKLSNEAKMSALADEMRAEIVWLAGPKMLGDSEKTLIGRAARAAGISFRKAKSFYYREALNPSAASVEAVRSARRRKETADDISTVARDLEALAERLTALGARGDRQEADRARAVAERLRRLAPGN
ncbi:hypothetical protein MKK88_11000 [Methylobacterium sp. E-005]|uniref:hypothetical protein n=1 Tax=Methylobacterium sp. E-005 TaxID=2836549 RepID=UPI001FB9F1E9|nr:hypothetical protein [Methylobacterium sp. E-005]MCJ2086514.1 hypothetical protein [Methylobacterium sp. E-005]